MKRTIVPLWVAGNLTYLLLIVTATRSLEPLREVVLILAGMHLAIALIHATSSMRARAAGPFGGRAGATPNWLKRITDLAALAYLATTGWIVGFAIHALITLLHEYARRPGRATATPA